MPVAAPLITPPSAAALHLAPFATAAVFVFLGGFYIPLPQEAVLVAIGYYFGDQHLPLWIAASASVLAVVISDNLFYFGARLGSPIVVRLKKRLNPAIVGKVEKDLRARPGRTIFLVRFIPGVRVLAPLLAGLSPGVRLSTYESANAAAAVLYVPLYVVVGFLFHGSIEQLLDSVQEGQNAAFAVALIAVTVAAAVMLRRRFYRKEERRSPPAAGAAPRSEAD